MSEPQPIVHRSGPMMATPQERFKPHRLSIACEDYCGADRS